MSELGYKPSIEGYLEYLRGIEVSSGGLFKVLTECENVLRALTMGEVLEIEDESSQKADKWMRKRGAELGEEYVERRKWRIYSKQYVKTFIEHAIRNILSYMKIVGGERMDFIRISYRVWGLYNRTSKFVLIDELLKLWEKIKSEYEYDEELKKIVFLASLQAIEYCNKPRKT